MAIIYRHTSNAIERRETTRDRGDVLTAATREKIEGVVGAAYVFSVDVRRAHVKISLGTDINMERTLTRP
jgi:hypothetical protein